MTVATAGTKELCKAHYWAVQESDTVTLHAVGIQPSAGYRVILELSTAGVFPPEYTLWKVAPSGWVPQIVTPFAASTSFRATESVDSIVVHDARGRHHIPVGSMPEAPWRS